MRTIFCIKNYIRTQGDVCIVVGLWTPPPPDPPVVYAAGRSGAVVLVFFLFCVALWFALRGASCLVLPCFLSICFFGPFSILITLLEEEEAGLCAYRAFVCGLCARWSVSLFLFHLVSGVGCGFCLWLFLGFSVCLFS